MNEVSEMWRDHKAFNLAVDDTYTDIVDENGEIIPDGELG